MTRQDLEKMREGDLMNLVIEAREVLDIKMGHCVACHGTGRHPGDEEYPCESCGGSGQRQDELGIQRLQEAGYEVTSVDWDTPTTQGRTWSVTRPDGKKIPLIYMTEDAAWQGARRDHEEWGMEG